MPASGEATQEGIAWITIPPRPRGAFWSIALWVIGDDLDEAEDRSYVLVFHHLSPLPDRWQSNFPGSVTAL